MKKSDKQMAKSELNLEQELQGNIIPKKTIIDNGIEIVYTDYGPL